MSVSLEGREPFLDHRIIEFMAQLPSHYKIRGNTSKYLLKKITYKYLPKEIIDRPKMGFGIPVSLWFKAELKDYLNFYLDKKRITEEGFFNSTKVIDLRDRYLSGQKENFTKLWFLLMFEMWYEKWM
jgi:asparagine synthase (glutamine-hydrolysing)